MKKVLLVGLVFGALALTSCKKDYECVVVFPEELGGAEEVATYSNLSKSDADEKKKACEEGGGTWRTK